jgi:membrane-bound lytic murein transglycosylase D
MRDADRQRREDSPSRHTLGAFIATLIVCSVLSSRAGADLSVPPPLQPQVDFWVNVFATYGKYQIVIHDTEHLDRVYSVLDFTDMVRAGASATQIELAMDAQEDGEKARIRGVLRRLDLAAGDPYLTEDEKRVAALFAADSSPTKYLDAAAPERIRGQRGLRERFARGIEIGHAYFPHMEAIFRVEGVPPEITRLPLVESCFNVAAYSKVGAAGVWQFMPGTARHFMRVDGLVDERLDPIIAARAAARFLRRSYERLGTWPLAITSYNHGPSGIARAVRDTGTTDIATIIRNYKGPAFKFASRNFYPEFLAALHVERNHEKYFGGLRLDPPLAADTVYLNRHTSIAAISRCAGAEPWQLADLNPSLLPVVHSGRQPIPPGVELRVPRGARDRFHRCYTSLPPASRQMAARRDASSSKRAAGTRAKKRPKHVVHKVRPGQTLAQIAARYGCSVEQLRRGNRLKGNTIRSGQVLRIPTS